MVSRRRRRYGKRRYGKRGYRRRRRTYRRRKTRRSRKFGKDRVQNIVRWGPISGMSLAPSSVVNIRTSVRLYDLPTKAELVAVYREYKIKHFALEIQLIGNPDDPGRRIVTGTIDPSTGTVAAYSDPAQQTPVYLHSCIGSSWDVGPTDLPAMREQNSYKRRTLHSGYNYYYCKYPRWMTEVAESTTNTAEVDRPCGWAATSRPSIPCYGRQLIIENLNTSALQCNVRYKYYLQFKGIK